MNRVAGFTLIEMLVVLVVLGIGISLAVPSFQGMLARNRIATQTNDLLLAISLARSEASRRGSVVSLQAVSPVVSDEFGGGYCVVPGNPGNCNGDNVIREFLSLSGGTTLTSIDDAANNGSWAAPRNSIQFDSFGALSGTSDNGRYLDLCHEGERGSRIHISLIGRAKVWRAALGAVQQPIIQPTSC